jgi:hypothetical protein
MIPNSTGVEKFFTDIIFMASGAIGHSGRKQYSPRQILNGKLRSRAAGQDVLCASKCFFIIVIHRLSLLILRLKPGRILQSKILEANHSGGRRCQDGPQRSEEDLDSTSRPAAVFSCV